MSSVVSVAQANVLNYRIDSHNDRTNFESLKKKTDSKNEGDDGVLSQLGAKINSLEVRRSYCSMYRHFTAGDTNSILTQTPLIFCVV
jgi:transposase